MKYPLMRNNILKEDLASVINLLSKDEPKLTSGPEVLKFEELYILSKKDFSDVQIGSEISRLTELKRRK